MDTRSKIIELLDRHPDLHYHGVGQRDGIELWWLRYVLLTPASVARVESVADWLCQNIPSGKQVGRRYTASTVKLLAERGIGEYVSVGALTVAAILADYPVKLFRGEIYFGMPTETIRRLCRKFFK
jgi:hypothetical protein